MSKIGNAAKLTIDSLMKYGPKVTTKKAINKIYKKIGKPAKYDLSDIFPPMSVQPPPMSVQPTAGSRVLWDVLFVNGCDPNAAPHPYRYRVLHQIEQLRSLGINAAEIYYTVCTPFSILDASTIVFYRCPYTEYIGGAIKLAKELNKTVLYDIDDLVIDKAYTDTIPSVQKLNKRERALYDEGVIRMGATLRMCDAATTTTTRLRHELLKYVPEVYINRNCASELMAKLSEDVCKEKQRKEEIAQEKGRKKSDKVIIGYFSGSLTHNADFDMIKPALKRIMDENPQVRLLLMGELDLPKDMAPYREKIIRKPFVDWKQLPQVIGSVDINLAPTEYTVFNEAKSENKWVEAALVKVPTVASRIGAFIDAVQDGETGFLSGDDEWYETLSKVVKDKELREKVALQAYAYCKEHYITTNNVMGLRAFYRKITKKHAAFVLPSCEISGGIMVALYHACFLQDNGWQVDIIAPVAPNLIWQVLDHTFTCISRADSVTINLMHYDLMVATMWTTVDYVMRHPYVKKRAYLVQNYEADFYPCGHPDRQACQATYYIERDIQYLTISKWCECWLKEKYHQNEVLCMKNGIRLEYFKPKKRKMKGEKIRILIEGDCAVDYKNIDESFEITSKLNPNKFEIWYMSYNATPKEKYRYDKFLHAVSYDKVGEVYGECDILLKSSWLESFSYPPLEMMATGGFCVVAPNGGNAEYLKNGENCLLYDLGDIDGAVEAIQRICNSVELREKLYKNGLETAKSRDWDTVRREIVRIYESILTQIN